MKPANMLQVKSSLSCLSEAIEQGRGREIVITRNGRLDVKLVPIETASPKQRIGIAKAGFEVPESIDACNEDLTGKFMGGERICPFVGHLRRLVGDKG